MDPFVVQLREWTQRMPTPTHRSLRRRSIASLILGGLFGLVAAGGFVAALVLDQLSIKLLGLVFLSVVSGVMIWNAIRYLRHLPPGADTDRVQFAAPFAFVISDDAIHFPERFAADPEDWPLAGTVVQASPGGSGGSLTLRCPGMRRRRFMARALVLSPAEISRLVEDRRRVPGALVQRDPSPPQATPRSP
jgi:hypothetical protein